MLVFGFLSISFSNIPITFCPKFPFVLFILKMSIDFIYFDLFL